MSTGRRQWHRGPAERADGTTRRSARSRAALAMDTAGASTFCTPAEAPALVCGVMCPVGSAASLMPDRESPKAAADACTADRFIWLLRTCWTTRARAWPRHAAFALPVGLILLTLERMR